MSARRRLTPDEADRNEDQHQRRYDDLYAEIEAADRDEHDREFGADVRFRPDSNRIHRVASARMQEEREASLQDTL